MQRTASHRGKCPTGDSIPPGNVPHRGQPRHGHRVLRLMSCRPLPIPFSFHVYIRRIYRVFLREKREEMHVQIEQNLEQNDQKNPANSCCETKP